MTTLTQLVLRFFRTDLEHAVRDALQEVTHTTAPPRFTILLDPAAEPQQQPLRQSSRTAQVATHCGSPARNGRDGTRPPCPQKGGPHGTATAHATTPAS